MIYKVAAHTDKGNCKDTNQDAYCIKIAETYLGQSALLVICDGMGGLKKGELASTELVRAFSDWFENDFAQLAADAITENLIDNHFHAILSRCNSKLQQYGQKHGLSLGTTVTALLLHGNHFHVCHVGDCRLYMLSDCLTQITQDQSYVAFEVEHGRMTEEEARIHPKRNMLLQCVGASQEVFPAYLHGEIHEEDVFMLCSDGFRHELTPDEIYSWLSPSVLLSQEVMHKHAKYLVELNMERQETDNITILLLKAMKGGADIDQWN